MVMELNINDRPITVNCPPGSSLGTTLRELGWKGVHKVCQTGDCGACTVLLEGKAIHSCIYPTLKAAGKSITTIEGLASPGEYTPMQSAFLKEQGYQCGYCTPGMILSATEITYDSEIELRKKLDNNLCRCTGYQAIIDSIQVGMGKIPENIVDYPVSKFAQVGQNIPKQDGPAIVTGEPIYAGDYTPTDLLHLKVLRSPHAHAHIRGIDTREALALAGVVAVFTYEDVPRRAYSNAGHGEGAPDARDYYLLDCRVRYIGQRVAAVVADSEAIAERACQLIKVDYEVLEAVFEPLEAMKGEIILHDEPDKSNIHDYKRNIAAEIAMEKGNVDQGFAEADLIIERVYSLPPVQHVHLEPHVAVTWIDEEGTLVVKAATQVPYHSQRILSEILDLPREKIRVIKPNLGGGFGNKQDIVAEDLCAFATIATGRPVRWEFNRVEEFISTNSRHAMQVRLKTGVKADGTILAMDMEAIGNTGAHGNHTATVMFFVGVFPLGIYRCPHQRFIGYGVYTNTMPAGAFRGYGATQGTFAVECHLDEIASKLNLDYGELLKRHLITPADEILIGREHEFHIIGSYGMPKAIDRVMEAMDYQPGKPPIVEGCRRRGIGFAASMLASGLAKIYTSTARMSLKKDGRYELRTGAADIGTGSDTTLRQIAAEVLETTVEQIDLIAADTQQAPFDCGSYASSTLFIGGQAVKLAAQALRSLLEEVATTFSISPGESTILAQVAIAGGFVLAAEKSFSTDQVSLTFAFLGVEVEVDTETGRITLLRCVQAVDLGQAINPRVCIGQVQGGVAMGIGYALTEELKRDELGQTLNPSLRTYRIPLARDLPNLEVILVETEDIYGPFGAKGVGEIGVNCPAPAIANAVFHATGVRFTEIPLTPERVWRGLKTG